MSGDILEIELQLLKDKSTKSIKTTLKNGEEIVLHSPYYVKLLETENKQLQQENKQLKEDKKKAREYIKKYESIKAYYEYVDEDGYDEYNYDEDFKEELLEILGADE